MNNRLPSGANVSRRKKEVYVSLAYIAAFLTPMLPMRYGLGDFSIGSTAGKGMDGAGDADRRIAGDEPNEERRLWENAGGFIGSASDVGVPGIDGAGDPGANEDVSPPATCARIVSGGAGLLDEIRLPGRSIFVTLLCWLRVN